MIRPGRAGEYRPRAGAFDTDKLERGDARAVTLDKPGTYRYYCVFHRFMQADLIVVE